MISDLPEHLQGFKDAPPIRDGESADAYKQQLVEWVNRNTQKIVLNVGSGGPRKSGYPCHWSFPLNEWREVRIDIDPANRPDIVGSMTAIPQDELDRTVGQEGAKVDAVFLGHALEHVFPHEAVLAVGEFLRVLKPGGGFLTHMPDLQQACAVVGEGRGEQFLYQSPGGAITAMDMVYGYRRRTPVSPAMAHKWGYTKDSLHKLLVDAGFEGVETWVEQYDLWTVGYKPRGEK